MHSGVCLISLSQYTQNPAAVHTCTYIFVFNDSFLFVFLLKYSTISLGNSR